ncbi:MAG: hypothetical protein RL727_1337 [Pseudomonadota bacterium]
MTITLAHYLVLGAILFAISVVGIFLNRRNVIILLMAIELMLLAVNMNFVAFSQRLQLVWQSWWFYFARLTRLIPKISIISKAS